MLGKIINFFSVDIWRIRAKDLTRPRSFFINQLRIFILAFRRFSEDKCQLRASALTFYSLLSIVPVFALAFGVAKGFGFERMLESQLTKHFTGQEEVLQRIITFSNSLLENTKGGVVAGIGVILLFWAVIKVLGNIESSFNDIWGIRKGRSIGRKISDYLSIMLICPFLVILSTSATVFIASQAKMLIERVAFLGTVGPMILGLLKFLPYVVIWVVFSFVYIFMPNTKVDFKSGIIAGIFAGTLYQIAQWLYVSFQIGATKYNAIYGSFAALPLFLIWLQISWLILFWGAEVSFAYQNVDTYEFEPDCLKISPRYKKTLSLLVATLIVKNFQKPATSLTAEEISHKLEMPIRLVRDILFELVEAQIISEIKRDDMKDFAYQPAVDPHIITIQYVLDSLENKGTRDIPVLKTKELNVIAGALDEFTEVIKNSPANKLLKEI